jgi:hypothetical protein
VKKSTTMSTSSAVMTPAKRVRAPGRGGGGRLRLEGLEGLEGRLRLRLRLEAEAEAGG